MQIWTCYITYTSVYQKAIVHLFMLYTLCYFDNKCLWSLTAERFSSQCFLLIIRLRGYRVLDTSTEAYSHVHHFQVALAPTTKTLVTHKGA